MASKPFSEEYQTYKRLCEEEVLALTGIKFDTWDPEGSPPSLDFHFREGSGWSFELYREKPVALLQQQIVNALKIGRPLKFHRGRHSEQFSRLLNDIPTYVKDLRLFRCFLEGFFPIENGMEATIEGLASETSKSIVSRVGESKAFKIYVESYEISYLPILIGLASILYKQLDRFRKNSMEHIVTWHQRRHEKQPSGSVSRWNPRKLYDEKAFQFAFAPSGSGKTASIFDELTRKYGHYMVSCALVEQKASQIGGSIDPSLGDLRQTFMDPKLPEGVSKDTHEIIRMLKVIRPLPTPPRGYCLFENCVEWWHLIFLTRSEIFRWFREALGPHSTPSLWLSFQLDCSEWDPFLQVFRVYSLLDSDGVFCIPIQEYVKTSEEVHWACIDEAQEDLQFTIEQKNLLTACMHGMRTWTIDETNFKCFQQVIFAGTSLNVSEALKTRKEMVEKMDPFHTKKGSIWHRSAYSITHRFPLVMNRDAAADVLKAFGIDNARAVEQSEPLWGRIKWTAMYAEKIIEARRKGETGDYSTMPNDEQGSLNFRELAEETVNEITDNLYVRLNALQERGDCGELLDQLLEAAISADILSRPHVFYEKSDLQLVEQGFAIIYSWMDDLESKLNGRFKFVDRNKGQLIAEPKEDELAEDDVVNLLVEMENAQCVLTNCLTDKLTDGMLRDGFTVVDCSIAKLATDLEKKDLTIIDRSITQLTAKPLEATAMTSEQIGDLAERITRKKDSFTVERYMKDKLTADMVRHGFTVWGCGNGDRKKLRELLMEKRIKIDKETVNQLSARAARQEEPPYMDDSEADQLGNDITRKGFVLLDKTMDQLLEASGDGFVIRSGLMSTEPRIYFRSKGLREQDFEIESETESRMRVKLKKDDHDTRDIKLDKIAASLKSCGLKIVDKTKDQLDRLVRGPFTVENRSKDELTAKLAERVVIDTIIQFSITNRRLDEKLMRYVRLAASRHGLGHFAENLLAVRLRQYLSQPTNPNRVPLKDASADEWALKQGQVLTCLAKAENFEAKQVDSLDDYTLVTGAQTVKTSNSWEDWERLFRNWLNAIESRRKPCASFLIPHDYFGPDLVFALRKKTEDENTVVLCSIQLKLGAGEAEAVNKSSITWACGERKGGTKKRKTRVPEAAEAQNLENMKKEVVAQQQTLRGMTYDDGKKNLYNEVLSLVDGWLQEINDKPKNSQGDTELKDLSEVKTLLENPFWRGQSRLSLLIAAAAKEGTDLGRLRPNTPEVNRSREYYSLLEETDIKSLFGETFETMLGILSSRSERDASA
ncbi:hypothetical protein MMC29_000465 [Sticta canariensis]|nr:hypothetical protein [Sticta canariensis]